MNINFKVIGLTRPGIKPKSTAPEADALTTQLSSEQLNFNKVCPKSVQNALKWPLQYVNFQKFSRVASPGPSGAFFFLFLPCFKLILPKNYARKMLKFGAPSSKIISDYASDIKYFQRAYLRPFPRRLPFLHLQ